MSANSRFKREAACALILNFWQRYASHATAVGDACIANEEHVDGSVAKLCFPIGKIILQGTQSLVGTELFDQSKTSASTNHMFLGRLERDRSSNPASVRTAS